MAAGLLLTVSLTLLGWGVEAQGGTQAKVCVIVVLKLSKDSLNLVYSLAISKNLLYCQSSSLCDQFIHLIQHEILIWINMIPYMHFVALIKSYLNCSEYVKYIYFVLIRGHTFCNS